MKGALITCLFSFECLVLLLETSPGRDHAMHFPGLKSSLSAALIHTFN